LTAASATLALNADVWFRRGRLFMVSPVHGDYRRCQAETPLIDLFKFAEPALSTRIASEHPHRDIDQLLSWAYMEQAQNHGPGNALTT